MKNKLISIAEKSSLKTEPPKFQIGDSVVVHQTILEGEKKRTQTFSGTVIAMRGEGVCAMFTVRRLVQGEGVERIFPLHSPKIAKVEIQRTGQARRAKLYYLRDRVGKATRLRERKVHTDTTPTKKKSRRHTPLLPSSIAAAAAAAAAAAPPPAAPTPPAPTTESGS